MINIGIDYSIKSTAMCVEHQDRYSWYIFPSEYRFHKKDFQHHEALKDQLNILPYERCNKKHMGFSEKEWYKFNEFAYLTDRIISSIKSELDQKSLKAGEFRIGFEGFSYGSRGSSALDLIVASTCTKKEISDKFGSFYTIAPSTVKKSISGKGAGGKWTILEKLLEDPQDPKLERDPIFNYIRNLDYTGLKDVPKPIDDLIDSYGVCRSIRD